MECDVGQGVEEDEANLIRQENHTEAISFIYDCDINRRPRRIRSVLIIRVGKPRLEVVAQVEKVDGGGEASVGASNDQDLGHGGRRGKSEWWAHGCRRGHVARRGAEIA